MHSFSVTSANIAVDDILLKLDSFKLNYIFFVPDGIDFDVIGPESNRIRWNNAKYWPLRGLRRSRSFKVTGFGTNRKRVYCTKVLISD